MHILCTNGTPTVNTLDHLPSFPLFIDYRDTNATISQQDEVAIRHALLFQDRVSHIHLHLPASILNKFLMLMKESFIMLERLSLSSSTQEDLRLVLPNTFLATNLSYLALLGIDFPKRLRFLSSTVSLVSLILTITRPSGYFLPRLLVARLRSLPQLEELTIEFSFPIPRPSAERELSDKRGTPVTLPNLKYLRFQGVSAYMECLVAQVRVPLLKRLDLTLFNQIAFVLTHLSHLIITTEVIKLTTTTLFFGNKDFTITGNQRYGGPFTLRVICTELDWQIDCAAQICSALIRTLSGVQTLKLDFDGLTMPTRWQNGEIDGTTWHELLRSFIGVNELHICGALSQELARALQVNGVGADPGLLPDLRRIVIQFFGSLLDPFIRARQVAGRPVCLR